jgi:acetyltransferase
MTDIETIAREVVSVSKQYSKPIYASFMGEADVAVGVDILLRNKIPHYILPESMCRSFSRVYRFYRDLDIDPHPQRIFTNVDHDSVQNILNESIANNHFYLPGEEAGKILELYGFPVVPEELATTPGHAATIAERIGFPVVMKVDSDDIIHKSDVGGVVLNVKSSREAEISFGRIMQQIRNAKPDAVVNGIQVSKMITSGEEVILGIKRDPSFGPVVMFGLGGLYVEVFKDVSFRIAPIDDIIADSMIREIKSYRILEGIRGKLPRDIASVKECLIRLSQLALDCPQIKELDINPLIVLEKGSGCYVADARLMLQSDSNINK